MTRKATGQVTTIGIDIGKNTFHLIGLDAEGNIALPRKLSRSQVLVRLANIPPCLIGMEAQRYEMGWANGSFLIRKQTLPPATPCGRP